MKRSPLPRNTPLRRHANVKPRNPVRLAKRRKEQFGRQAALCRTLPCCACGAPPPSDPHHVRSRGAGGLDKDTAPLCMGPGGCHAYCNAPWHSQRDLEEWYKVDLRVVADDLARRVAKQGGACG
jgi:hypothetical protein